MTQGGGGGVLYTYVRNEMPRRKFSGKGGGTKGSQGAEGEEKGGAAT